MEGAKARISSSTAFILYGVLLGFLFIFFVAGLYVGKNHFVQADVAPRQELPAELGLKGEVEPLVDFYRELSTPAEESEPEKEVGRAGGPEESELDQIREGTGEAAEILPAQNRGNTAGSRPATESTSEPAAPVSEGSLYTIQAGAHTTREEARQVQIRLEAAGFDARIQPPSGPADRYFRVWVGEFSSIDESEALEAKLKSAGFHTYVRRIFP